MRDPPWSSKAIAVGGMRKPADPVYTVTGAQPAGRLLKPSLERYLESHPDIEAQAAGILTGTRTLEAPSSLAGGALEALRSGVRRVHKELGAPRVPGRTIRSAPRLEITRACCRRRAASRSPAD